MPTHRLHTLAAEGDLEGMKVLVQNVFRNLSVQDDVGAMPIHHAPKNGHKDVVAFCLDQGQSVDVRGEDGWTPLHYAARYGQEDVISLLLERKANIGAKTCSQGCTPLHIAAIYGERYAARLLVKLGADIAARSNDGYMPIHEAAVNGHAGVVGTFLNAGQSTEVVGGKPNYSPLILAANEGHAEVIKLLIATEAKVDTKYYGKMAIHVAALNGHTAAVEAFLDYGESIEAKTKNKFTPLHCAAQEGHVDLVKFLLSRRANSLAKQCTGHTPGELARDYGHRAVVELIEKHNAVDDDGEICSIL